MTDIAERVRSIVIAHIPEAADKEITDGTRFVQDLGVDSIYVVEIILALEEEFGVKIPDEDAEALLTFGATVKYIIDKKTAVSVTPSP